MTAPIDVARTALAQAKAYRPSNDHDRRRKQENVARLEAWIAARTSHPAGGEGGDR